jgi:hypothetical protein
MRRLYPIYALAWLVLYTAATWAGWSPGATRSGRTVVPPSVRQAPGGYRNYGYWRGGK